MGFFGNFLMSADTRCVSCGTPLKNAESLRRHLQRCSYFKKEQSNSIPSSDFVQLKSNNTAVPVSELTSSINTSSPSQNSKSPTPPTEPNRVLFDFQLWMSLVERIQCSCGSQLRVQSWKRCGEGYILTAQCAVCSRKETFSNTEGTRPTASRKKNDFDPINVEIVTVELLNRGTYESYSEKARLSGRVPMSKHLWYKITKYVMKVLDAITLEDFDQRSEVYKGMKGLFLHFLTLLL
jgi:hypothetical protein